MKTQIEELKATRDKAQADYATIRRRSSAGQATKATLDLARSAYLLAQDEYRAALIKSRRKP